MDQRPRAILLLSGGIDSAVAGALYRTSHDLITVTVEYGQPTAEKLAAISIADWLGCKKQLCRIPSFSATREPSHYFPMRNLIFLAHAAQIADQHDANIVIIGANADDQADYPDCRREFFDSFARTATVGSFRQLIIVMPLIDRSKAEVVKLALRLHVPLDRTMSCYRPRDRTPCGECNACKLRRSAFEANGLPFTLDRLEVELGEARP